MTCLHTFFSSGMLGSDQCWPGLWDDKGKAEFSEDKILEQMKDSKLPEADSRGVRAEPATDLHRDWHLGTSRHFCRTGDSVTSKHPDKE